MVDVDKAHVISQVFINKFYFKPDYVNVLLDHMELIANRINALVVVDKENVMIKVN